MLLDAQIDVNAISTSEQTIHIDFSPTAIHGLACMNIYSSVKLE